MTELKRGWEEDAPKFEGDFVLSPAEMIDVREWVQRHGASRPTTAETLMLLMAAADDEKAPAHIRRFLWQMLHYPELVRSLNIQTD